MWDGSVPEGFEQIVIYSIYVTYNIPIPRMAQIQCGYMHTTEEMKDEDDEETCTHTHTHAHTPHFIEQLRGRSRTE